MIIKYLNTLKDDELYARLVFCSTVLTRKLMLKKPFNGGCVVTLIGLSKALVRARDGLLSTLPRIILTYTY